MRFVAVDLPEANDLTVGIMALVAQQEREAISKRTKEALAVAKARGVKLGNPNGAAALKRAGKGGAPLRAAIATNADRHARDLAPVVADIRGTGSTSLRAIAGELNARGMLTRRGGRWHVSTVLNLLDRFGLTEGGGGDAGGVVQVGRCKQCRWCRQRRRCGVVRLVRMEPSRRVEPGPCRAGPTRPLRSRGALAGRTGLMQKRLVRCPG